MHKFVHYAVKAVLPSSSLPVFLTGVVFLALLLRLIVAAVVAPDVAAATLDHNEFGWEMGWVARSIFLGQGFSSPFLPVTGPTALVPPIYPYILAAIFRVLGLYSTKSAFAILAFNSLCSSLTCIPIFLLVRNALNVRIARISAFAWAIYPFAIYFSAGRVWDYALTSLLFTTLLLLAQRLHLRSTLGWVGFGALYGIAALVNPSIVSLLPVLLLIALYKVWRVSGAWFLKGLVASLVFFAVCTPWTMRNDRDMHTRFFIRDGFWIEFYAGNNGDTKESNSAWAHPASSASEMSKYESLGEIAYIADKGTLAKQFVAHHPGFFAVATARRVIRFWTGYWSFSASYIKYEPLDLPNVPFCLFLIFFLIRGIRRWRKEDAPALLPFLCTLVIFPLPYYVTHSSMDYRQPIEPLIIILVTVGLFGTRTMEGPADALQLVAQTEPTAVIA